MTKKQDNKPESKPKKVDAVCEICKAEVKVPNLQKNACPECGRAGLVAAQMPHYGTPFTREVQRRAGRARGRFNTEKPRLEKSETTERAMELRRRFTSRRRVV